MKGSTFFPEFDPRVGEYFLPRLTQIALAFLPINFAFAQPSPRNRRILTAFISYSPCLKSSIAVSAPDEHCEMRVRVNDACADGGVAFNIAGQSI